VPEPIWVVIHMLMEMSQLYTQYNYLKQTKMSFVKNRGREGKTGFV
jgi:hypothetical protein